MAGKNTVGKVGYHMTAEYDLHFLRKKRNYSAKKSSVPELPLVSLIDMFTILVIFLIMNFSTEGEGFFIPKGVQLPLAANAQALKSAPLISISSNEIVLDTERRSDQEQLNISESAQSDLKQIVAALNNMKQTQQSKLPAGETFKGQVNIQADENLSLDLIKKVMRVCVQSGWGKINFAVRQGQ